VLWDILISGKQNHLLLGDSTNGSDDRLDGISPLVDVRDIMRLVHDAKDDLVLAGVFVGQLRPDVDELVIGRATLTDDLAIPARIWWCSVSDIWTTFEGQISCPTHSYGSAYLSVLHFTIG